VAEMLDRTAGIRQGRASPSEPAPSRPSGVLALEQFCAGSATSWGV